jgi:hypothetical protein
MERRLDKKVSKAVWMYILFVVVASAPFAMQMVATANSHSDQGDDGPKFGPWSAPVNLGPPVNSAFAEQFPAISKEGLSLYFSCFDWKYRRR